MQPSVYVACYWGKSHYSLAIFLDSLPFDLSIGPFSQVSCCCAICSATVVIVTTASQTL